LTEKVVTKYLKGPKSVKTVIEKKIQDVASWWMASKLKREQRLDLVLKKTPNEALVTEVNARGTSKDFFKVIKTLQFLAPNVLVFDDHVEK
jgi:hypothetical protein